MINITGENIAPKYFNFMQTCVNFSNTIVFGIKGASNNIHVYCLLLNQLKLSGL